MTMETIVLRPDEATDAEQEDSGESSDHSSETGSEAQCSKFGDTNEQRKTEVVTIKFTKSTHREKTIVVPLIKRTFHPNEQNDHEESDDDESDSDYHQTGNGDNTIDTDEFEGFEDFSVNPSQHAADEMKRRLEEVDPCEKLRSLCKKGEVSELIDFLKKRGENGVDIDYVSSDGWTCLHEIITHGCQFTSVARILLEHGAKVDTTDFNLDTPLHASLLYHNTENTKLLLEHKANCDLANAKGRKPIHNANDVESLELLVDHGASINARDGNGNSPLHYAVMAKDVDRIKLLLSRQCDISAANNAGSTALHLASDPDIVQMLLENVAEDNISSIVNAMDGNGNSPVHLAVRGRHRETVRQLVSKRGRHDLQNANGKSPLSLAKDKEMKTILLKKEGTSNPSSPASNTPSVKKVKSSVPATPTTLPDGPIVLPGNKDLQSPSILKRKRHECINGMDERKIGSPRLRFSDTVDYSGVEKVQPASKRIRAAPLYTDLSSDED